MNYAQYLQRIIQDPTTPREAYTWALRELQNIEAKQVEVNAAADAYAAKQYCNRLILEKRRMTKCGEIGCSFCDAEDA